MIKILGDERFQKAARDEALNLDNGVYEHVRGLAWRISMIYYSVQVTALYSRETTSDKWEFSGRIELPANEYAN